MAELTALLPIADLPVYPATVAEFGSTLVVAPHPDDETLGCGGAIALLRQRNCPVQVLVVSDGTRSHPNSRLFTPPALRTLRETETLAALAALSVTAAAVTFLRLKDQEIPEPGTAEFEAVVADCRTHLQALRPATVLLPWRRDPHVDHRATWKILQKAVAVLPSAPRLWEYPVWSWEQAEGEDIPMPQQLVVRRLDISAVLPQKLAAIAAHCSQTTDLIPDDPEGFRLTPEMLAHFTHPWELYLEATYA